MATWGEEWCRGGVVPASFSCTQAVFAGGLGWVSPLPPSPRQPGSRTAPARVHCVPGSAVQSPFDAMPSPLLGPCPSPCTAFWIRGVDPRPRHTPLLLRLLSRFTVRSLPGHHTPLAIAWGPKPPLGLDSLELRLGSMPGYKETSLGSSPSWHPPSRLLSVLYTSAFLSLPFFSPI